MRLKIVNRKKFRKSIILFSIILFGMVFGLKSTVSSEGIIQYKTITVKKGDTLWGIAEYEQNENSYYKDKEIQKIVSDLKKVNNLDSCNLTEKQNLKIPTKL